MSDSATLWSVAHQPPLVMRFSRQEYCSGLPFPLPGDLPDLGIKPESPVSPELQADSSLLSHRRSPQNKYNQGESDPHHLGVRNVTFIFLNQVWLGPQPPGDWDVQSLSLFVSFSPTPTPTTLTPASEPLFLFTLPSLLQG